jgi:hypothetical protein
LKATEEKGRIRIPEQGLALRYGKLATELGKSEKIENPSIERLTKLTEY